ncbi:hypothetical protein M1E11_01165 [Bacillus sp. JZ8]
MTILSQLYLSIYNSNQEALPEIDKDHHPLTEILKEVLTEQQEVLERLLLYLEERRFLFEDVKEPITILYHNFDILKSTFHAYERSVKWTNEDKTEKIERLSPIVSDMKKNLGKAGDELEKSYGFETIQFVVPSFYLSKIR